MSSTTTETTATMTTQDAPTPQEGSILLCKFFRGVRLNKWISCHRVGNSVIFVLIALWPGWLQNGILLYITKVRVTYATNVLSLLCLIRSGKNLPARAQVNFNRLHITSKSHINARFQYQNLHQFNCAIRRTTKLSTTQANRDSNPFCAPCWNIYLCHCRTT